MARRFDLSAPLNLTPPPDDPVASTKVHLLPEADPRPALVEHPDPLIPSDPHGPERSHGHFFMDSTRDHSTMYEDDFVGFDVMTPRRRPC